MATGSGKTFTAANVSYRLVKHADARRVLFLVDRANLGRQTLKEFQGFTTLGRGRRGGVGSRSLLPDSNRRPLMRALRNQDGR
jgi:type I site-specific restriction-modification system R (restriction) subunit